MSAMRVHKRQKNTFDPSMIDRLQSGIATLSRLLSSPKESLKTSREIKDAGKAKRIDAKSIDHLSSHPQYLHKGDGPLRVVPEKILSLSSLDSPDTYENRFLMTLYKRATRFIEDRYCFYRDHVGDEKETLYHRMDIGSIQGEILIRYRLSDTKDHPALHAYADMRSELASLRTCAFVKQFKDAPEVFTPIHPTNLLLKNEDYHACLDFFEYLDRVETLGVEILLEEEKMDIDQSDIETIERLLAYESNGLFQPFGETKQTSTHTPTPVFSLEEECTKNGEILFSHFPNEVPVDPFLTPMEQIRKEEQALNRLVKRQKAKKQQVQKDVMDYKDKVTLDRIQKRRERKP